MSQESNLEDRIEKLEKRIRVLEHDRALKAQLSERNPVRFSVERQSGKIAYPQEER